MDLDLIAIAILVVLFAAAAIRDVHIGVVTLPAAFGVGIWLAKISIDEVFAGFPVSILVLLVGVTYFFGIAQVNGTIDRLVEAALRKVGNRAVLIPLVFFGLTMGISAMGSPLAGLVTAPVAMPLARRFKIDPMLMALAVGCGLSAGGFAPTSLFGIVTYGTARDADIPMSAITLFLLALAVNLVLFAVAFFMFGGPKLLRERGDFADDIERTTPSFTTSYASGTGRPKDERYEAAKDGKPLRTIADETPDNRLSGIHWLTVAFMVILIALVVVLSLMGKEPDIGVLCFALAAVLAFIRPTDGKAAIGKIDWSTALLVGGIITYVSVLQAMGAVDTLGEYAAKVGAPIIAAFVICLIGGLVSAFASTTGILAALVPLAIPLVAAENIPGWAIISALGVCSSIVDVSPFSTVGATLTATTPADQRERVTHLLTRWGLSMIVIGPVLLVFGLVWPSSL